MQTPRPTPFAPATGRPIHTSSRTAISENVDALTGQRSRVLVTSELTIRWVGDEVRVEWRGARIALSPDRMHRPARRMR